jgi:uncharacterized membrane protein YhdT
MKEEHREIIESLLGLLLFALGIVYAVLWLVITFSSPIQIPANSIVGFIMFFRQTIFASPILSIYLGIIVMTEWV